MALFLQKTTVCVKYLQQCSTRSIWTQNKIFFIDRIKPCYRGQRSFRCTQNKDSAISNSGFQPVNNHLFKPEKRNLLCSSVCQYQIKSQASQKMPVIDSNKAKLDNGEFTVIYKFPFIIHARLVSRAKLYQTGITLLAVPTALYFYQQGQMSLEYVFWISSVCLFAVLMLYIMSGYLRRIIGIISMNKTQTKVKVSHLTFWGKRNDVYFDVEDFIPFSDTPENTKNLILHVKTYKNPNDKFYLFMGKYGQIVDLEKFENVFGKLH